jgi:hypothetical protein
VKAISHASIYEDIGADLMPDPVSADLNLDIRAGSLATLGIPQPMDEERI